jgi:predicted Zn-dependent protease with MMP-like domain
LYRSTIERWARDQDEPRRVIAHTVEHEVAHYFGISDERLRDLGAY